MRSRSAQLRLSENQGCGSQYVWRWVYRLGSTLRCGHSLNATWINGKSVLHGAARRFKVNW